MKTIAYFVLLAASAFPAGEPAGFNLWKASQFQTIEKQLTSKVNSNKFASETLATYDNHHFMVAHRQGNGEAEIHGTQHDIFVIESGKATLVVGGTVVNPKTTGPGEIRGPSIEGGYRRAVAAGDAVHIPAGMPHQLLVSSQVTYFVVKIAK